MNWTVTALTEFVQRLMSKSNPLKPAFLYYSASRQVNGTGDGTTLTGVFGTKVYDHHGDFDGVSTFTAPVTGVYLLTTMLTCRNIAAAHTQATFMVATSNRSYCVFRSHGDILEASSGDELINAGGGVLADMDAGDTATATLTVTGSTRVVDINLGIDSHFSGVLMA